MAETRRQEHDRQGRVPADRGDRGALREHPRRPLELARARAARPAARRPARARRRCSPGWRSSGAGASGCAPPASRPTSPNLVMGANVQVCWEKFCRYWDVEPRLVPMEGDRFHLDADEAVALCDENTIGVVAILGSTFDGSYEPVKEIADGARRRSSATRASTSRCTSTPPPADSSRRSSSPISSGTSGSRACSRSTPRATSTGSSTRASAGRSGATRRRCPKDLIFDVNYLGGHMPTFALNFSRPGSEVVAQYYMFASLGREGYRAVHAGRAGRGDAPVERDRQDRAVPADHRRRRAAGVRVHAQATEVEQLHGLRRLRPPPRSAAGSSPPTRSRRTART